MNLDALVVLDRPPWEPCRGAQLDEEWHTYDVPLVGTFTVDDDTVLFAAMGDATDPVSVWAYCPLTSDEASQAAAASYDDTVAMQAAVEVFFAGKEAVVALARDLRIWQWGRVTVTTRLLEAAGEFLTDVVQHLASEQREPVVRAQIEAATKELALARD